jgi:HPt (histidine-containing phosphotransfer) domain-containing protein
MCVSKPVKKQELQIILAKWLNDPSLRVSECERSNPENGNNENIIDQKTFNEFLELVEDAAPMILEKHFEVAKNYLQAINIALDAKNYTAMANSAHPLKSSSQQIGAVMVGKLAAQMEKIGQNPEPDLVILRDLMEQLEQQQNLVEVFVSQYFAKMEVS